MLSKQEIESASPSFDETDIVLLTSLLRTSVRFKANPSLFSDFPIKLERSNGTIKARQINAAHNKIIEIGAGEARIEGGEDALFYSQRKEREAWIDYIISVLYVVSEGYITAEGTVITIGSGDYDVRQREIDGDFL